MMLKQYLLMKCNTIIYNTYVYLYLYTLYNDEINNPAVIIRISLAGSAEERALGGQPFNAVKQEQL